MFCEISCFWRKDQDRCLLACPSDTELEILKKQSALHLR